MYVIRRHCQVDHVVRHEHGGPTAVSNRHLLRRDNHSNHIRQGRQAAMIDTELPTDPSG